MDNLESIVKGNITFLNPLSTHCLYRVTFSHTAVSQINGLSDLIMECEALNCNIFWKKINPFCDTPKTCFSRCELTI
jgi:hypothetical protein